VLRGVLSFSAARYFTVAAYWSTVRWTPLETIMSVFSTGPGAGLYVKSLTDVLGIGATINAAGQFVAATGPEIRRVTATPNGIISDFGGSLALDVTNGVVYVNNGTANAVSTAWSVVSAGAAANSTQIANGTAYTNSTDETVLSSYTIPAGTLRAGTRVTVQFAARVTVNNGATTLTGRLRLGGTTLTGTELILSSAVDTDVNFVFMGSYTFISRAAPGAAVPIVGTGSFVQPVLNGAGNMVGAALPATNFATNAPLLIELTGDWSAADANSVRSEIFSVTYSS
jgi:hypothetical protein